MSDPRGRGPLGADTNTPRIDPQTQARTRHAAPSDRKTQPTSSGRSGYFDVARLLPVLAANGWTVGEAFMRFWIAGPACIARLDSKKGKATISANLDNACMRIYTISWDWLLGRDGRGGFAVARENYQTFVEEKLFNEAALREIIRAYGRHRGPFGVGLTDGLSPEKFRDRIPDEQLQNRLVSVPHEIGKLDDLVAALADFGYYAMYRGETIVADQFGAKLGGLRALLTPLRLVPAGLNPKEQDAKLLEVLRARFQALIVVDAVGVYVGDIYEFNGWQYLGNWNLKNLKVWGNRGHALDSWLLDDVWYGPDSINVENATFRHYRDATGRGGDFLALSPIKLIPTQRLILVPVP